MTAERNIELIKQIYAAFGRGDLPAILERLASDVDWGIEAAASSEVPWHGIGRGHAFATGFFTALARECEFPRFEPSGFLASDREVACLLTFEVKLKRNGRSAVQNVMHRFAIANGKVTKWRGTEDTAHSKALWGA